MYTQLKRFFSFLVILVISIICSQNTWAQEKEDPMLLSLTVKEAKLLEAKAIVHRAELKVSVAEKELEYAQKTDARLKEKINSEYQDTLNNAGEIIETAMTDLSDMVNNIDIFLGITDESTKSIYTGALDNSSVNFANKYLSVLQYNIDEFEDQDLEALQTFGNGSTNDMKVLNAGIRSVSSGVKAVNHILYVIQQSIESNEEGETTLTDEQDRYIHFRTNLLEYLRILRSDKKTLLTLDDPTTSTLSTELILLNKEYDLRVAKTELAKAQRILVELLKTGDTSLKNL